MQHEQIPTLRVARGKKNIKNSNLIFSIKKIKNQKKWTREEDELLIALAEKYNEKHWKEISKRFIKKNSLQCFSRFKRIRPGIVKGSWKKEEDYRIIDLVNKYGKAWSKISKILGTRNGKQIRDRFINVLDPEIRKGKFTDEEDRKLISLFRQYGSKWATIAKYYPNRTADMIKNRFHSSIKKKLTGEDKMLITKECKEEVFSMKDYSTECSTKSLINLSHVQNFSIPSFTKKDLLVENVDNFDNGNFHSTLSSRVCDSEFYSSNNSNNFNYDIIPFDREVKVEDSFNPQGNTFMWNFDDYFTI
jgi:hypothetical protein